MPSTWEPRPLPRTTPETREFWEAAARGELLLQSCSRCGEVYYYARARCPACGSDDVEWSPASGTGEVYSFSWMADREGWPDDELPLVVAYVELEEGVRLLTNLVDCDPREVSIGDAVEVRFVSSESGDVAVPVFAPV